MRSMLTSIPTASALLLVTATGCVEVDSCADYVSYMCDCHGDDEDVDCATLEANYEAPSSEDQDECSLALDDQVAKDIEEEYVCGGSADTDPPS